MKKRKILVVEDDLSLSQVFTGVVQSISDRIEVDWTSSAEEALARLQRRAERGLSYDLIVADIFLEGRESGLDFWTRCQALCPETPVLVMSSLSLNEFFASLGYDVIAPPFLEKPFQIKECRRVIKELLDYSTETRSRRIA